MLKILYSWQIYCWVRFYGGCFCALPFPTVIDKTPCILFTECKVFCNWTRETRVDEQDHLVQLQNALDSADLPLHVTCNILQEGGRGGYKTSHPSQAKSRIDWSVLQETSAQRGKYKSHFIMLVYCTDMDFTFSTCQQLLMVYLTQVP